MFLFQGGLLIIFLVVSFSISISGWIVDYIPRCGSVWKHFDDHSVSLKKVHTLFKHLCYNGKQDLIMLKIGHNV